MSKRLLFVSLMIVAIALGVFAGVQKSPKGAKASAAPPTTLIHFITVKWKDDATDAQKQAALDGAQKLVGQVPGLLRVWTKTTKLQTQTTDGKAYDSIIAMEFTNQAALDAYAKHKAHDEWYKVYTPIRAESRTHDVSN